MVASNGCLQSFFHRKRRSRGRVQPDVQDFDGSCGLFDYQCQGSRNDEVPFARRYRKGLAEFKLFFRCQRARALEGPVAQQRRSGSLILMQHSLKHDMFLTSSYRN